MHLFSYLVVLLLVLVFPSLGSAHGVGLPHVHQEGFVDWTPFIVAVVLVLLLAVIGMVARKVKVSREG